MQRSNVILSLIIGFAISIIGLNVNAQNQSILDFTVKELNGDTIELREKIDPHSNYIIETMAFWCNPCVKSINKFNYHKNYWKERFNVDILLIEDEHWDDLPFVINEMQEFGWDLDIVVSNKQYSSVGINSIPRYYFKGVSSDTVERVYGNIEKFLLDKVDSIKFSTVLDKDFKQSILGEDCNLVEIVKYDSSKDTMINQTSYYIHNDIPFRESGQNGNIIRFDEESEKEEVHIKYSAALCSRIWIKDLEGDSLLIKILDRYQEDSILHLVTDQILNDECTGENVPFEFIQNIGSNAGLFFNIEDNKIVSRLICHKQSEEIIYSDEELGSLCSALATSRPTQSMDIQTYPNPTNESLFINMNFEGEKKIDIYTSNGMKVISQKTNLYHTEIQLPSGLNTSLLLVKIRTRYGVYTKKVLKIDD